MRLGSPTSGFLLAALMLPTVATARPESIREERFFYKEEGSFGTINPNEPAKPARREPIPQKPQSELPPQIKPAPDLSPGDGYSRPKYRDIFDQASKEERSYGDEESASVSLGVGFNFRYFAGNLGVTLPFNRYVAWSIAGNYLTRTEKKEAEITSGGDVSLLFRIPNRTPMTPFLSLGPGLESWRRSMDEGQGKGREVFDDSMSATFNWSSGISLRLARYVALVGALKSTTYTDRAPRVFTGDHSSREPRTDERFELGFAFIF